jgi:hypothetical protein
LVDPVAQHIESSSILDVSHLFHPVMNWSSIFVEVSRFLAEHLLGAIVTLFDEILEDLLFHISFYVHLFESTSL